MKPQFKEEKWYVTTSYGDQIEEVTVYKETTHCVWIKSWRGIRRTNKRGYDCYFPTWQEAKAFIVNKARKAVEDKKHALSLAEERLREIEALKEA